MSVFFCFSQTNFYVEDEADGSSSPRPGASASPSSPSATEVDDVGLVEAALLQLSEEEAELDKQQQELRDVINARYAVTLTHVADARDTCLKTLRAAAQDRSDSLRAELTFARDAHYSLLRHTSRGRSAGGGSESITPSPASLTESERERLRQHTAQGRQAKFFQLKENDTASLTSLQEAVQDFLGVVVPSGKQNQQSSSTRQAEIGQIASLPTETIADPEPRALVQSSPLGSPELKSPRQSSHADLGPQDDWKAETDRKLSELTNKLEMLTRKYTAVEEVNKTLRQDLRQTQDNNTSLLLDLHAVKKDLDGLKHKQFLMYEDVSSHDNHLKTVLADNAKLSQDVATLKTDNAKLQTDATSMLAENAKLHNELSAVQRETAQIQTKMKSLQTSLKEKGTEITALKDQMRKCCLVLLSFGRRSRS